jgi:HEPN domain-containing protein
VANAPMAAISKSGLQALALSKLGDARILLRRRRDSGAYYLAGYAVEFALKAVIASQLERHVLPEPGFLREVYHHDLDRLVAVAKLRAELDAARRASIRFDTNWTVVKAWSVESRYELIDRWRSAAMIKAVGEASAGVLPWLQKYW